MMYYHKKQSNDTGTALLITIALLGVLTVLSGVFFAYLNQTLQISAQETRNITCTYLADAGINKALAEITANPATNYRGEKNTSFGEGSFTVCVTPGTSDKTWHITATGFLPNLKSLETKVTVEADATCDVNGAIICLSWKEVS